MPLRGSRKIRLTAPRRIFQVVECGGSGGCWLQVVRLSSDLAELGFEVTLLYNIRPGGSERELSLLPSSVRLIRIPSFCREIRPLRDFVSLWALLKIFRRERPEIVHLHSSKAGFLGRVAGLAAGVPKIFYTPAAYAFLRRDVSALLRGFYWVLEFLVSRIGIIVAVGPSEAAAARRLSGGRPVLRFPMYVIFPPEISPPAEKGLVAALGRLAPSKRPELFIRTAKRVRERLREARFVWIGGGELEAESRRLAQTLEVPVEFTGMLPQAEALRRLSKAEVVVHTSQWDGLATAILEAQAAGKPVVATRIPANADAVEDGETGFLGSDESELAEHIIRLLQDESLRREMGEKARARIEAVFGAAGRRAEILRLYEK